MVVGSGMTLGFAPNGWNPTLATNTVNYTFANSQAAPNEFALFETHDPWGFTIVKDAITGAGHTFTEFTPADLAGFDFSQYRVVILNWDDTFLTDFNAQYSAAIPALEAYVNAGGVVWVQAAIQGNPGDNYPMPFGGQGNGADFSSSDPVVDPADPILDRVQRGEQEVSARSRLMPAPRDMAVAAGPCAALEGAHRRPDLRVQHRVDGRPLGRRGKWRHDVEIHGPSVVLVGPAGRPMRPASERLRRAGPPAASRSGWRLP